MVASEPVSRGRLESDQRGDCQTFVAGRSATGHALEDPDLCRPKSDVQIGRQLHQASSDRSPGRNPVGSSKGQVRTKRFGVEIPSSGDEGSVHGRREVRELSRPVANPEP